MSVLKKATSERRKASMPTWIGDKAEGRRQKAELALPAVALSVVPVVVSAIFCNLSTQLFCLQPSAFCSHSYFQSGSSGCFKSHSGRRLRTVGSSSKL